MKPLFLCCFSVSITLPLWKNMLLQCLTGHTFVLFPYTMVSLISPGLYCLFVCISLPLCFWLQEFIKKTNWLVLPLNVKDAQLAAHLSVMVPAEWCPWGTALICCLPLCRHHYTLTTPEQQALDSNPATYYKDREGNNISVSFCDKL